MKTKKSYYQPLFDYMYDEHGLMLISSDLQEIINICNNMNKSQINHKGNICKCEGGATGRTITEDFEYQVCDTCGGLFGRTEKEISDYLEENSDPNIKRIIELEAELKTYRSLLNDAAKIELDRNNYRSLSNTYAMEIQELKDKIKEFKYYNQTNKIELHPLIIELENELNLLSGFNDNQYMSGLTDGISRCLTKLKNHYANNYC